MFHSSSSSSSSSSSHYYADYGLFSPLSDGAAPHDGRGGFFFDANGYSSFPPPTTTLTTTNPPTLLSTSPPFASSLPSFYLQRSSSFHSLSSNLHQQVSLPMNVPLLYSASPPQQQHLHHHHHHPLLAPQTPASVPALSSSPSSSSCDLLDFKSGPVRRVFSTGDLQGVNGLQVSGENHNQEGGADAAKVGRYSAEERKERIERYRSKRNQRNFHKKITYACRKTLADSRPRVRGRFARNGENEAETEETEAAATATRNYVDFCSYGIYDHVQAQRCCSSSGITDQNYDIELLRQMQATLAQEIDNEPCAYDDELLASFADVFSMNLLS